MSSKSDRTRPWQTLDDVADAAGVEGATVFAASDPERRVESLVLDVFLPLGPRGKQRARAGATGTFYTPSETEDWEVAATAFFRTSFGRRESLAGPVVLEIEARFGKAISPPEGPRTLNPSKPDLDNIEKIVMDALAPSRSLAKKAWVRVMKDDRFVCVNRSEKVHPRPGEKPGVRVRLFEVVP